VAELSRVAEQNGDASRSDGVQALSRRGVFAAVDVGEVRWIDVDTQPALERAEAMLRVFGDDLGDEPDEASHIDADAIETFAPSWVRAAKPYDEQHFAVAEKKGAARMMSNESPFPPSERVMQAIIDAASRGNHYPGGSKGLSDKISRREGLASGSVLFGAGSTELIDVVIRTFVGPGEEVLLSVPTFSMYEARTRVTGGIPILVPMTESHDHDLPALIRAVNERTKVIFLCSPNNPTGNALEPAAVEKLLVALAGRSLVVVDEAYIEFSGDRSLAGSLAGHPHLVVLRTLSKAYGLAGARVGSLIADAAIVALLGKVIPPYSIPQLTIEAVFATLAAPQLAVQRERVAQVRGERERIRAALATAPGVRRVWPSVANFLLVDFEAAESALEAARRAKLLIRDMRSVSPHSLRISVGTPEQNDRLIRSLA